MSGNQTTQDSEELALPLDKKTLQLQDGSAAVDIDGMERVEARQAVHAISADGQKPLNEVRRFAVLTAAAFAMICASTSYAFNLFSGQLQTTYKYKFRDMSNINTVGMVFAYFLIPYGIIYDLFGPLPIFIISCTYFCIGALLMGLTFQGVIAASVVRFCVYNALLSLGSQLFDLGAVVTVMSVFPTRRGWVIAILKTLMGLGQAVIGSIKSGFFASSPSNYFYFLIALVVVVTAFCLWLVRLPAYHLTQWQQKHLTPDQKAERTVKRAVYLTQQPPMWRFYFGIALILVLVVYLPLTTALLAFVKSLPSHTSRDFTIVAVVLTCCFLLMMMPCPQLDRLTTAKSKAQRNEEEAETIAGLEEPALEPISNDPALHDETFDLEDNANAAAEDGQPKTSGQKKVETDIDYIAPQYQTTFLQSCRTLKFWCIFWTMFCGLGCEFVVIFNARYIYAALDGKPVDDTVATLLTVLNGAGSALGRLGMSVFESWTQHRPPEKRIPITLAYFVPPAFLVVSIVLFLVVPGRALLLAYAIAALGNGFCASITILIVRTIYANDPAKHYNFGICSLVPAAILINRLLFGEWYAVQAGKQSVCYRRGCVQMPMIVMLGLNCSSFLSNTYVHFSYKRFVSKVLAERRRIQEEAAQSPQLSAPMDASGTDDLAAKPQLASPQVADALFDGLNASDSSANDQNARGE